MRCIRKERDLSNVTVSISGDFVAVHLMSLSLDRLDIGGIEINCSCPNAKIDTHQLIPSTKHPIYLKLACDQDPYRYDLDKVNGIRMNSIGVGFGAMSGKYAQKKNWKFIEKFNKEGFNVAGCSVTSHDDIKRL